MAKELGGQHRQIVAAILIIMVGGVSAESSGKEQLVEKQGFSKGLQDVVAAESAICAVDGQTGKLSYRGIDIRELARESTFEETSYLLWLGTLPTLDELRAYERQMWSARELPQGLHPLLQQLPRETPAMDSLRTAVSAMAHFDPDAADNSPEANRRKAIRIMALIPMFVAAQYRLSRNLKPLPARTDLTQAGSLLYQLTGSEPNDYQAKVLDIALILHADHELNASTFAARVTAATLSDVYSSVVSAIGTLKGPLHGGANEVVMRALRSAGPHVDGRKFVAAELEAGRKISGFGHRVYRTWDPRALVLRELACPVSTDAQRPVWCKIQMEMEQEMVEKHNLYPNVDFYSATLYDSIGIPIELFTPVFAISRAAGWLAHILEQYGNNRLIRPRAEYVGPENVPYIPIEQRTSTGSTGSTRSTKA